MGQKDDWIAAIASYVRNAFGNTGGTVSVADVARVRTATTARKVMWTAPELEASLPVLIPPDAGLEGHREPQRRGRAGRVEPDRLELGRAAGRRHVAAGRVPAAADDRRGAVHRACRPRCAPPPAVAAPGGAAAPRRGCGSCCGDAPAQTRDTAARCRAGQPPATPPVGRGQAPATPAARRCPPAGPPAAPPRVTTRCRSRWTARSGARPSRAVS